MAETLLIAFVVCILIGMPISIAMGVGALGGGDVLPGAQSDHHPDALRRAAVRFLSAAVGAAVHPGGQHRRARRRGARADRPRHRAGRPFPRRPRLRQRAGQHVLRRHLGLGGGRRLGARHLPGPADGAQGLRQGLRHRAHRLDRRRGADHPALDHRRDLRLDGRQIGGRHVRRRRHPRHPGRARHGGAGILHRPQAQLSQGAAADRCRSSGSRCAMRCRRWRSPRSSWAASCSACSRRPRPPPSPWSMRWWCRRSSIASRRSGSCRRSSPTARGCRA